MTTTVYCIITETLACVATSQVLDILRERVSLTLQREFNGYMHSIIYKIISFIKSGVSYLNCKLYEVIFILCYDQ